VNTLVLRERIDPDQDLSGFIRQVGQSVLEAQLHQDLPFEKLVEELKVVQDASRHPVFQVMFGVQAFGGGAQGSGVGGLLEGYGGENSYRVAQFDLTTMLDDSGEEIRGVFNYATSVFEEETMVSYMNTYKRILNQIATLNS